MNTHRPDGADRHPVLALDAKAAAAALDLPYTTFVDKVRRGEIAHVVTGGGRHRTHRRFLPEDLRAWALRNRVPAKWENDASNNHRSER